MNDESKEISNEEQNIAPTSSEGTVTTPIPQRVLFRAHLEPHLLLGSGLTLAALFICAYFYGSPDLTNRILPAPLTENNAYSLEPFRSLNLEARAVYVYDVRTGEKIYGYEEETQLPLASLTKLMTAVVAAESLPEGTIVTVDESSLEEDGDNGLGRLEHWNAKDLLDFTLVVSSNDGARALAATAEAFTQPSGDEDTFERVFISRMNERSRELGLSQTYFHNETGLDLTEGEAGAYGSARDIALLLAYALKHIPETVQATAYRNLSFISLNGAIHEAQNTNERIDKLPGLIASKTGYTDLAGGNLVIAFDAGINHPVIVSVLGSSRVGRFDDVEKLVAATLASLQSSN